jgi:hypothetical protein
MQDLHLKNFTRYFKLTLDNLPGKATVPIQDVFSIRNSKTKGCGKSML